MGTIASRLAKLEQQQGGQDGAQVIGVRRVQAHSGTAPDVVKVQPSGEQMTEAEFRRRYPRGLIVVRTGYGTPTDEDLEPV